VRDPKSSTRREGVVRKSSVEKSRSGLSGLSVAAVAAVAAVSVR
jgi:hypothetical protein